MKGRKIAIILPPIRNINSKLYAIKSKVKRTKHKPTKKESQQSKSKT